MHKTFAALTRCSIKKGCIGMTNGDLITLLAAAISSGLFGVWVTGWFGREKTAAEARAILDANERSTYTDILMQYREMHATQSSEVERLDALVSKLSVELGSVQNELVQMRRAHQDERRELVAEISELHATVKTLQVENDALQRRIVELEGK
jgi:predicted RNase H-like nuclease (RuvC/YqgF family)